ncbi:MAG: hypothetical protein E7271_03520 [Lachnospiraceae bacterium]|nr:hypothetical protein [Lachnospiraceae bacterium]
MIIIYLFLVFLCVFFPLTRFLICNLPVIVYGAIKDLFIYIKYKRWNECNAYGRIISYCGLFGQGKTKECVRFIVGQYNRYNGRMIFDFNKNKWVQQQIVVYSNVDLNIPYVKLTSLQQLVDCQYSETGTVNLFLIDEASVVFNSREFKTNFSTPALNTILTSRHHKIGVFLTSQRFNHMDALLRQVTSYVYECKYFKPLRIQQIKIFDAWEVENCSNLLLMKPLKVCYSYSSDKIYNNYDTNAMVEDISKKCVDNGFYDDSIVLGLQGNSSQDSSLVSHPRRKLKKRINK